MCVFIILLKKKQHLRALGEFETHRSGRRVAYTTVYIILEPPTLTFYWVNLRDTSGLYIVYIYVVVSLN